MATLTWEALGGDPVPGDPSAFDALSQRFSEIATDAADALAKLDRFKSGVNDSIWRGESAQAFRENIGKLPPRLAKLHDSYATAAEGMGGYGRALRRLQDEARAVLGEARSAQRDADTTERLRDQARATDPTAPTAAHDRAIEDAQRQLRGARDRIDDLRDRRRAAENAAIARLERAQDQGIPNDPWWKRAWDSVDRWVDEHAGLLRGLSYALSFAAGVLAFVPSLQGVAAVLAGLAVMTNVLLAATGNGEWKTLLVDAALGVAGAGAGRFAVHAVRAYKVKRAARFPIAAQKQAGHVRGTPHHLNRLKAGKPTSTFDDAASAERYTREAWAKGKKLPGRPGEKIHDFGRPIGHGHYGGTQSQVRVIKDKKGRIHGHPTGPETPP